MGVRPKDFPYVIYPSFPFLSGYFFLQCVWVSFNSHLYHLVRVIRLIYGVKREINSHLNPHLDWILGQLFSWS